MSILFVVSALCVAAAVIPRMIYSLVRTEGRRA